MHRKTIKFTFLLHRVRESYSEKTIGFFFSAHRIYASHNTADNLKNVNFVEVEGTTAKTVQ